MVPFHLFPPRGALWSTECQSASRSFLGLTGLGWLGGGSRLWGGCGGWGCLLDTHLSVLASDSLLLADGVLCSSGGLLVLELLLTDDFGLDLVDGLDEDVLVLELVTLGAEVELVVDLSVNLLSFTISLEESTEDTGSSHPEDLGWHTSILGTSSATLSVVAA